MGQELKMGVIYTGQVDALIATLNRKIFAQQHLDAMTAQC